MRSLVSLPSGLARACQACLVPVSLGDYFADQGQASGSDPTCAGESGEKAAIMAVGCSSNSPAAVFLLLLPLAAAAAATAEEECVALGFTPDAVLCADCDRLAVSVVSVLPLTARDVRPKVWTKAHRRLLPLTGRGARR